MFDDRTTNFAELLHKVFNRELFFESGNSGELGERADGVIMLDATHHGHDHPGGHRQRNEHEGRFVTHSTGGILIDLRLRNVGEVDDLPGKHHFFRQFSSLLGRHLLEIDRHKQRR